MVHGPAGFGRRKFVAGGLGLLSLAANRALGQRSAYSDSSFAGGPITGPFRPYWESLKAYRYPEFRVAEPVGIPVSFQRFPIGTKRTRNRSASETTVRVCTLRRRALLSQRGVGGCEQTGAARDEPPPAKPSGSVVHFEASFSSKIYLRATFQPSTATAGAAPRASSERQRAVSVRVSPGSNET